VTERQSHWLLVAVLGAQLVLLSSQVPDSERDRSLLEGMALRAVAPFADLVARGAEAVAEVRLAMRSRAALREENHVLRQRLRVLEEDRLELYSLRGQVERLREAAHYVPPPVGPTRVADVVLVDYGSWLQTLILYVGREGAREQQPVVTSDGLVGRVVVVAGPFAKVQLITDRAASVGAMLASSRRQGVVRGGADGTLEMDFVPLQESVAVGDEVLTAGIDGVFPRGLPVGTVTAVDRGDELFHRIRLAPAVDFGRLDQVFLLAGETLPEEVLGSGDESP
jgi:rod shape-determining protein MreC